ncbi:hypothetical protein QYF50_18780 [Paenibacillus vini]|uniref:hypothetical protein n=1 Tax=Paenibacillus vini TaxID=1476024 RepID=UPI0025B63C51|nr:hypothetical protein [Paenibacillus vini]MDN4069951.1 hypothetical protein [Paenibacillus vini]
MSLIKAKSQWVWTETAQEIDPERIAGRPITDLYPNYGEEAPLMLYERGYIVDKSEYTGQTDLFDFV